MSETLLCWEPLAHGPSAGKGLMRLPLEQQAHRPKELGPHSDFSLSPSAQQRANSWGDPFPTGTLVKGFLLSFNMAARHVSSRALSRATAMSANLNCNNQASPPVTRRRPLPSKHRREEKGPWSR